MLGATIPFYFTMVRQDLDRQLVMTVLDELRHMVDKIQAPVLQGEKQVENIMSVVKEVIYRQVGFSCYNRDKLRKNSSVSHMFLQTSNLIL